MSDGDDQEMFSLDPGVLQRAEAALAALAEGYGRRVTQEVSALGQCLTQALATGDTAIWQRAFGCCHDIKGQAATFGYPLLSQLAAELCRHLEARGDAVHLSLLVAAMEQVVRAGLTGDGGETGAALRTILKDGECSRLKGWLATFQP